MRFTALASDYDGTIAPDGTVPPAMVEALERCCASGRKNILVTGRELPELLGVCHRPDLFDWIVAENGGVLYCPKTKQATALGPPPSPEFVATLRRRGVEPCSTGHVVVATRQPHETVVLQTIRDLGLELQVIFNKGAVMVLPSGINKATGLAAALAQLKIDAHCVVAVGDAENDHALLESCGLGVAVANAVPLLKAHADWVTDETSSEGVQQLIARLLENDLADLHAKVHGDVSRPVSN
jgi:hydroxymethylpyrimidine pyrophosphatase-like HAD family hydrolase